MDVRVLAGQLIRLPDGRPVVCVGGEEDTVLCLHTDLPQDAQEEVLQARAEVSKALGREATAKLGREKAEKERAAMLHAMKLAVQMLPQAEAQEIRGVYSAQLNSKES